MVAQRLPQVGIIDQRYVFRWPPTGKAVSRGLLTRTSPAFITAEAKINLSVDNAFASIDILLNRTIRHNDTAPAAKLYAALQAITVSSNQVHSILEGARYPPLAGALLVQPVGGKKQDIRAAQGSETAGFKKLGIHADESCQAANRSFPDG